MCCCTSGNEPMVFVPTAEAAPCCSSGSEPAAGTIDLGVLLKEFHVNGSNEVRELEEEDVQVFRDDKARERSCAHQLLRRQLLSAVRRDDAPGVLQHVAECAGTVNMGEALRLASLRGSASVVRELVAVGICVNEWCPRSGFTPLQLAAAHGHVVVCELLLDALADVHRPVHGATALVLARRMGNVEVEEAMERHVTSLLQAESGQDADDSAQYRRAHVLPRVSPVLSEAVLQAVPAQPLPLDVDEGRARGASAGGDAAAGAPALQAPRVDGTLPVHALEAAGRARSNKEPAQVPDPPSTAEGHGMRWVGIPHLVPGHPPPVLPL